MSLLYLNAGAVSFLFQIRDNTLALRNDNAAFFNKTLTKKRNNGVILFD